MDESDRWGGVCQGCGAYQADCICDEDEQCKSCVDGSYCEHCRF